ncbi:MAG: Uma2 family endonuclease [Pyrinomonadaceae bacterium]|nr:Uma2 family endonuclease [Pyrinomonadaceae bacterium]MDQ3133674.1 Uma2 family endonuclease [Acidobacteriota bacterium]
MSRTLKQDYFTVAEYLAFERAAETKHEYAAGEIIAMSGASRAHNLITGNIARRLGNQLDNKPCETYSSDMRVRVTPKSYYYPNVVVVCSEPRFEDAEVDTLLNPTVAFEILSKSTEARDRGDKFFDYRALDSLSDYVLVAQDKMRVEQFVRQPNGEWALRAVSEREGKITLTSIGCELTLAEIYQRVVFPPARQLKSVGEESPPPALST